MNKSIKAILAMLSPSQRAHLQYAFENGLINQYVEFEPGHFVGVNIQGLSTLEVEQTAGFYSAGTIIQGQTAYVVQFPTKE